MLPFEPCSTLGCARPVCSDCVAYQPLPPGVCLVFSRRFPGVSGPRTAPPLLDDAAHRLVASERERIRIRERARLQEEKTNLRPEPKAYMKNVVERLNLRNALMDEKTINHLMMAGFRGQGPVVAFLFARFVLPLVILAVALIYLFFIGTFDQPPSVKVLIAAGSGASSPSGV